MNVLFSYGLEGLRCLVVELSTQRGGGYGIICLQAEELLRELAIMAKARPLESQGSFPLRVRVN